VVDAYAPARLGRVGKSADRKVYSGTADKLNLSVGIDSSELVVAG
jgi:hypothetical protein